MVERVMVSKDISEDILYRSVGLKAWWNRGSTQKAARTFMDGIHLGFIIGLVCLILGLMGFLLVGAAYLIWELWPAL